MIKVVVRADVIPPKRNVSMQAERADAGKVTIRVFQKSARVGHSSLPWKRVPAISHIKTPLSEK